MVILMNISEEELRRKLNSIKMIVFDFDGTLTNVSNIWDHIHRCLGTLEKAKVNERLFMEHKIDGIEWGKRDSSLWIGRSVEELKRCIEGVKLYDNCIETLIYLKKRGYIISLISAGLDFVMKELIGEKLFDHVYINQILIEDGKISGANIKVSLENKGILLKKIMDEIGLKKENCAAVGDGETDLCLFKNASLSIVINPIDGNLEKFVDVVLKTKDFGELKKVFKLGER
ncbi:MAG: HAD-IB family phosphatase [Candidatus Asgardarchaeia archaeon]